MPHPDRSARSAAHKYRGLSRIPLWALPIVSMMFLVLLPASAQAATSNNGTCEDGEFCYYYNSNKGGSLRDFTDLRMESMVSSGGSCYTFKSAGSGQGVCVKNNAASVWNRSGSSVAVYYNSNFGGSSQNFASGAWGNLNTTLKNNNASHRSAAVTSSSTKYFYMSTSGVRFGSTAAPSSVTFWSPTSSYQGGLSVRGTLEDTDPNDGHDVFFHASVRTGMDGVRRWSPRIYTDGNGSVRVDQYLYNGDVQSTNSVLVEACTDRGTLRADYCVSWTVYR
jgi:hypothetical protein